MIKQREKIGRAVDDDNSPYINVFETCLWSEELNHSKRNKIWQYFKLSETLFVDILKCNRSDLLIFETLR